MLLSSPLLSIPLATLQHLLALSLQTSSRRAKNELEKSQDWPCAYCWMHTAYRCQENTNWNIQLLMATRNAHLLGFALLSPAALQRPAHSKSPKRERLNSYTRMALCVKWNIYFQGPHRKLTCWALHFSNLALCRDLHVLGLRGSSCKTFKRISRRAIYIYTLDFHVLSGKP